MTLLLAAALCALYLMTGGAEAHVMRSYNFVNVTHLPTTQDMHAFFSLSRASGQSVLLGAASPECWHHMDNPYFRAAHRGSPAEYVNIATVPGATAPLPMTHCAELFWYPRADDLAAPSSRTADFGRTPLADWLWRTFTTTIILRNGFSFPIRLFYLTESGEDGGHEGGVFQGTLAPGESMSMGTHLGHVFAARTEAVPGTPARTVDFVIVSAADEHVFSADNYFNGDESCAGAASKGGGASGSCPNLGLIQYEATFGTWHRTRLALNYLQPQVVRAVTQDGFRKIPVPAATFAWLRQWYDDEKARRDGDIEGSAGPCMNQREAPSLILHLPPSLKSRMAAELQPLMQDWYQEPARLHMTSIYGVRTYTNGSVLAMHVDTLQTHVVSAIINVDQDVDEPWLLKILDHYDEEVELEMAPGEMVLYESAKLLHGRPVPMNGRRYENIFIHYQPESGWEDYEVL